MLKQQNGRQKTRKGIGGMQPRKNKYQILADWLQKQITEGELAYGERLYSENELCEMFGYSRQTVRQAIGMLESAEYLTRKQGSGTFVAWRPGGANARTNTIGVISTYIDDYIFPSIIRGIEQVLSRHNYTMQLVFTHNRIENEMRALQTMADQKVDGIIVEPTKSGLPNPNLAQYKKLAAAEIPLIFFNAYYPGTPFPHVALNDEAAGKVATEHLIRAGHRNIAGIFQSDDRQGHLRYAGYLQALIENDIHVQAERVLWYATEDLDGLFVSGKRVLNRLKDCTAVVCYNDRIAADLMVFLGRKGVAVPGQVSVIGIDNAALAGYCEPPLTSVDHPKEVLGRVVAENLLRRIEDPTFDATVDFDARIIERGSVEKVPKGKAI